MKKLLLYFIIGITAVACAGYTNTYSTKLTPKIFSEKISNDTVQLVDVRTPEEYKESHIPSATNINYSSKNFNNSFSVLDKTKPVFIYCRSGKRSNKSAAKLKKAGFTTIYELEGGILNWTRQGLEVNK